MMSFSDVPPKEPQMPDCFKGPVPMEQILEALTLHLPYFLTGGDKRKWWTLNRSTWSEHVDREDAQEAEFRELYADMTSDG